MPTETATTAPQFSVIIPVYNDWEAVDDCLRSLHQQTGGPEFEVVIVDDGSQYLAPESIRQWSNRFPLTIAQQPHTGIAAARNRGVQTSKGTILIFTDADCRFHSDCLSALVTTVSDSPQHEYFQLHLSGDSSTVVGKAEELRLTTLQDHLLQPDGCIRYLNTSGFALRRSAVSDETFLFDPSAQRSEDTLLLTNLIQKGKLPFFVTDAVVRHTIRMSLTECIRKDVRVAWLEARTFERIAARSIEIRMKNRERIAILRSMWKASRQPSIGRIAWFVLAARQGLQRAISLLHRFLPFRSKVRRAENSP
jgi:glycosyltransferase involved in cell wall biosynthesis